MRIDPHVHCRDGRECHKETIEHVFKLCDEQGVDIIFDMPNTDPPLLTPADVKKRLKLVPSAFKDRYRLFVGATSSPAQLIKAVKLVRECDCVVGIKLYAGQSVGALAVTNEKEQRVVYKTLAEIEYKGVLAVHCEKQSLIKKVFDPEKPSTHALSRPIEAETASIADQIRLALESGFMGVLHVCHVSASKSVSIINKARDKMKITCGVTPHHLLWSESKYKGDAGLLYKINPPLRSEPNVVALREALKSGLIDWIETDHAPHALSEKLHPPFLSGYPSLCLYRHLLDVMTEWGLDKKMIEKITCENIVRAFNKI